MIHVKITVWESICTKWPHSGWQIMYSI